MKPEEEIFTLLIGKEKLGELKGCEVDGQWLNGSFEQTPLFQKYKKFFTDEEKWDDNDKELDNIIEGIYSKGLFLIDKSGRTFTRKEFKLYIDENTASLRL